MKKLLLTTTVFLALAAFAMAGGQTGDDGAAMMADGPQYGGEISMFSRLAAEPASPAESDAQWIATFGKMPIQETLAMGDMEKYGPRGTGEYAFQTSGYLPTQYVTGRLLESWEIGAADMTCKVREGIMWAPTETQRAWMPVRELTADDIVQDIHRFWKAPWGNRFEGILADAYTTGKYTFVIEFEGKFNLEGFYYLGWEDRSLIAPPEMIDAGDDKWENQVGTGPFQFEEYVSGSHMSYVKNPDYWDTTMIDGKEYEMPFIDRLVTPIIPDQATQVAALRTGRIDFHYSVPPSYWPSLEGTGLSSAKYSSSSSMINMAMWEPPFDDIRVRKALRLATDITEFQRLNFSEDLPRHHYPMHYQHPAYISEDELPEDIRALYDYSPENAKKLLAEAGYPNGIEIDLYTEATATRQDDAALAKDQWAKAGIIANIIPNDATTHTNFTYNKNYHGTIIQGNEIANPINSLYRFGHSEGYVNHSGYKDPEYDAIVEELATTLDPEAQLPLMEKAQLHLLRAIHVVPIQPDIAGHFWWPWLKNYDGEVTITDGSPHSLVHYIWVDESMK